MRQNLWSYRQYETHYRQVHTSHRTRTDLCHNKEFCDPKIILLKDTNFEHMPKMRKENEL